MARQSTGFTIRTGGKLIFQREDGTTYKTGIRVTPTGEFLIYDQRQREWFAVPFLVPVWGGGQVTMDVEYQEDE